MATMADAIRDVTDAHAAYHRGPWASLRKVYEDRRALYKGELWNEILPGRDKSGGTRLRFPLQINPIAKACRIHRAILLGVSDEVLNVPPISTTVVRSLCDPVPELAERAEKIVARVWRESHGIGIQMQSCLQMQYFGGHVFHLRWEPWNTNLAYRIGIRSYHSPAVFWPVAYDPVTYQLQECYIGYKVKSDYAKVYYGVSNDSGEDVLYLEHWTEKEYEITVDGKQPRIKDESGREIDYAGENSWKRVPIVYIPHDRDDEYYGRSLVDGDSPLEGLAKEWNSRQADKGDAMQDSVPIFWTRNARRASWAARQIIVADSVIGHAIDLGEANPISPQAQPELGVTQASGLPASVADFPAEIKADFMSQADLASAAFGEDDVSGGRITGPVTAYRMLPTTMHTAAERGHITEGLSTIARLIFLIASERQAKGAYKTWGVSSPQIEDEMKSYVFGAQWRPMLPIAQEQRVAMLNERLGAGGISIESYLREMGNQDPEREAERIWEDRKRQAELEAEAQARFQRQMGGPQEDQ